VKKTWTIAGALDLGLQALGDHLETITKAPSHDGYYTKQLAVSVKALVAMAGEARAAGDPKNAPADPKALITGIVELLKADPEARTQVEKALKEARAS
jgi:hypothetical protein